MYIWYKNNIASVTSQNMKVLFNDVTCAYAKS